MRNLRRLWKPRLLMWVALLPLLWLALRNIPFVEVGGILARLQLWQLLCLVILNGSIFLLFAGRWWLILRFQGYTLPFLSMIGYRIAGFGITYFTPGPQFGGEPLQVHLIRSRHTVPTPTAVAAVTLDKLLELQTNFAFLILGVAVLLQDGLLGGRLNYAALLVLVGFLILPAGFLVSLWFGARPLARLSGLLVSTFPHTRALRRLQDEAGLAENQVALFCRQKPLALLVTMLLSLLAWAIMGFEYWLSLRFLGLRADLFQTITLLTAARIAFLLPVPAGVGTLEASQVFAAGALGIHPAVGVGISLLIRARDISLAGLGLYLSTAFTRSSTSQSLSPETGDFQPVVLIIDEVQRRKS